MKSRQDSGDTVRAASDGQIVFPAARVLSRSTIVASMTRSISDTRCRRQISEQQRRLSHSGVHFLRHVMRWADEAQILSFTPDRYPIYRAARLRSWTSAVPSPSTRTRICPQCARACAARGSHHVEVRSSRGRTPDAGLPPGRAAGAVSPPRGRCAGWSRAAGRVGPPRSSSRR